MDIKESLSKSTETMAKKPTLKPFELLKKSLTKGSYKDRFIDILGEKKGIAMCQNIILTAYSSAELQKVDPLSIIYSSLCAAVTDLSLDKSCGQSAIIPYKGQCQFQIMKNGYIELALRSNLLQTINETRIYEGEIEVNKFTGDVTFLKQLNDGVYAGNLAFIRYKTGFEKFKYMSKEEIMEHAKKYSQSFRAKRGLWIDDFNVMAKKTVLKLLLKEFAAKADMRDAVSPLELGLKYDQCTPMNEELTQVEYLDNNLL